MPFDTGGKYTMESYKSEFIEFMVESDVSNLAILH